MVEFQEQLAYELIENDYLEKEEAALHHRSTRIQEGIGHGLLCLQERYVHIAGAPQECISAAIALQSIFMMSIMKSKYTS